MGYCWYTDDLSGERMYSNMRPKAEIAHLQSLAPAGRWTQGIWHNGAAVVKDVDGLVSWLSFT